VLPSLRSLAYLVKKVHLRFILDSYVWIDITTNGSQYQSKQIRRSSNTRTQPGLIRPSVCLSVCLSVRVRGCRLGIERKIAQAKQIQSIIPQNHESKESEILRNKVLQFAGSRRVLATAVDDWSGKPYCVSS